MAEITVKVGRKPTEAEANPDKSKVIDGTKPTPTKEAEGQRRFYTTVTCYNCWALNDIIADTEYYVYFRCWNCYELNMY